MNHCLQPNKILYDKIDKKMEKISKKMNRLLRKNIDHSKLDGGAITIIPAIIGVVITLFTDYRDESISNFPGIYKQMLSLKRGKKLHIPNDLEYDIDDERRRFQLFDLLTKNENDGKQLQVYNSFTPSRRDQVDIQRCLYILTTAYVEHKYGKRKNNDSNIKSVIYSVFCNHLYLLALIGFFIRDDDSKEEDARLVVNDVIDHAMLIESIYLAVDDVSGENISIKHLKPNNKSNMVTRSQTKKKHGDLSFGEIYPSNDEFIINNDFAGNDKLKPMKTRSQTIKSISENKSVVPALGWERVSHMRYIGKYTKGGKKSSKKRRRSSTKKKR
jgi:hypothetical protein